MDERLGGCLVNRINNKLIYQKKLAQITEEINRAFHSKKSEIRAHIFKKIREQIKKAVELFFLDQERLEKFKKEQETHAVELEMKQKGKMSLEHIEEMKKSHQHLMQALFDTI